VRPSLVVVVETPIYLNSRTEAHPKPSSKRIENMSLATFSGHLNGGVHDRPFKQYLTRSLSAKPVHDRPFKQYLTRVLSAKTIKQHLMEIVPAIGFQALRQNLCKATPTRRRGSGLRIPETDAHPRPSSKRIENVSFATLFGHLKGGVHDRSFKK
jgi:hypothetical protein